ncbi:MAG TPA: hypothetical protein VE133_07255 [Candidatus Sulfotelmatobacter sp.]|nr:hypothetical protein [Candidatus Sulfotelmatobacter sp.]
MKGKGSFLAGIAICWLLNLAQIGIGWLILVADARTLPAVLISISMIGLVQVGYVVPLWRLLQRKGSERTATGLVAAAGVTLVVNAVMWLAGPRLAFPAH